MANACAIIPAAGRGLRMGKGKPKQFLEISGKPIIVHTLEVLSKASFLMETILVIPRGSAKEAEEMLRKFFLENGGDLHAPETLSSSANHDLLADDRSGGKRQSPGFVTSGVPSISIVEGGTERQDSVFNALEKLPADCQHVLIHDGVRPFVSVQLLEETWKAALENGAAIAAVPATDTVKRVEDHKVLETLSREEIWLVQTPQVFRRDVITNAYQEARKHGWSGTDDAAFVERIGHPVSVVVGERTNIKVTTPDDLTWAEGYLRRRAASGAGE